MMHDPPSPFIAEWAARLAALHAGRERRRALDIAMGRGRHAEVLARAGFEVFGMDIRLDAVRDATVRVAAAGSRLRGWCADLRAWPLPDSWFDAIIVARYLQRDLVPSIGQALRPGGVVLYETFTTAQRVHRRGPTSPDHLLQPGELPAQFAVGDFDLLFFEEVNERDALARAAIRRRIRADRNG